MPAQVESVSPLRIAPGIGFLLVVLALIEFGLYRPSTAALGATGLLTIVLLARGVHPFGDSVAYRILQATAFALWGMTTMLTVEVTLIAAVFAVVGLGGMLLHGRQALREGVWSVPR